MLPEKDPAESVVVEFDFSSELPSVLSAITSISIEGNGIDPSVSSMLVGAPQVSGTKVLQRVSGGVSGVLYKLRCEGTMGANVIVRSDHMPVSSM